MDDFFKEPGLETGEVAEATTDTSEELIEDPGELDELDVETSPIAGNEAEEVQEESIDSRLARLERERDEAKAVLAAQEQARIQHETQAYWVNQKNQADAHFAAQEAKIYQEAANAYDPTAFVKNKMAQLNQARDAWTQQYYSAREQGMRQAMEQMAIPGYASEVARHYGLSAKDTEKLLRFHPDQMPQVAELIAEAKGISPQQLKQQMARSLGSGVAPGGSRASGGRKIKAGSDAHLAALFKQGGNG